MARNTPESIEKRKEIGRKIRELRLARGFSRQQIAAKVGVTHQQFQKYENGSNRIDSIRFNDIAKELGVDISYFLGIEKAAEPTNRSRATIELIRIYGKLSWKSQDAILTLARSMERV